MSRDYKVGYGKPPADKRWRKGQSGNPQGRPKLARNFKTDLQEELHRLMVVREGGKERRVTKQRALIMRQLADAVSGKSAAAGIVGTWIVRLLVEDAPEDIQLSAEDREVLEFLNERTTSLLDAHDKDRSRPPGKREKS